VQAHHPTVQRDDSNCLPDAKSIVQPVMFNAVTDDSFNGKPKATASTIEAFLKSTKFNFDLLFNKTDAGEKAQ